MRALLLVAAATRRSVEPPARRGPSRSGGNLSSTNSGSAPARPPYAWRSTWRTQPLLPSRRLQAR
jgi:hypothetical protein